jgi:hypothetical protein
MPRHDTWRPAAGFAEPQPSACRRSRSSLIANTSPRQRASAKAADAFAAHSSQIQVKSAPNSSRAGEAASPQNEHRRTISLGSASGSVDLALGFTVVLPAGFRRTYSAHFCQNSECWPYV